MWQPYRVSEEAWFGNMTKSPTRKLPPQTNEEPPPRHRNVYDYDGEYEFPSAQHWTAPDVLAPLSALPPKADIAERDWHVRFVPKADIGQRSVEA